jgi:UPF0271 protein
MKQNFTIDINCDLGEGLSNDSELMKFISSANIACGYHAGDDATIRKTIELCMKHDVAIGAHPGFNDKENFGRTEQEISDDELYNLLFEQLEIISAICNEMNTTLHHVKPHGALYTMAAKNQLMSKTIAKAVFDFNPSLVLYGLSGSFLISEAKNVGLKTADEVFADRTYQSDGSLTSRKEKNALITNTNDCLLQVMQMIVENSVTTVEQKIIPIQAETLCIHGDGEHAVDFARVIYSTLNQEGIKIKTI